MRVFEAETPAAENVGLLYMNQVGSSMSEDAGRDAQFLRDQFDLPVLGFDRPGSGRLFFRSPSLRREIDQDVVQSMTKTARRVAKEAESLGLNSLVANGRSAAAPALLALTRTELAPVDFVFITDPLGVDLYQSAKEGEDAYKEYNRREKQLLEAEAGLVHPDKPDVHGLRALKRLATMVPYFFTDKYHSGPMWLRPEAVRLAGEIAAKQPDVDVTIEFAETGLLDVKREVNPIHLAARMRELRGNLGAPFDVRRVPHTVHASFDKRDFYASRLAPSIERATAASRQAT